MQTLNLIANSLGVFLILLALNAVATGLLVGGQMLLGKISGEKSSLED